MTQQNNNWKQCLRHAEISDVGMRRSNNQDSLATVIAEDEETWRQRGSLFLVADGMGAHAAGELASKLAADGIPHLYVKYCELPPAEALQKAIFETSAEIHRRGLANADFYNMGTTASALLLTRQGAFVGHVGDSRVYRLRGDRLEQLTFDHSLVWELRAAGHVSPNSELANAIPKNVITRSLGPNATVKVDIEGPFPIQLGDTFLLCSDGLTGEVSDEELGSLLANLEPDEATRVLVDLANLRGGPDNVTILVAKVVSEEITTYGVQASRIFQSSRNSTLRTVFWGAAGGCYLAFLAVAIAGHLVAAFATAAVGTFFFLAGFLPVMKRGNRGGVAGGGNQRLGEAPYTDIECPAKADFVHDLEGIVNELKQGAADENWSVNLEQFDEYLSKAKQASSGEQYSDAVRNYAYAIGFMMQQLRGRGESSNDSAFD